MFKYVFLFIPCFLFGDMAETPIISPPPQDMELPKPEPSLPPYMDMGYQKQFSQMFLILVGILACGLLITWLFRRYSPRGSLYANAQKNIKILERRHLSPNTFLYHIQVGDKQFVIAESKFHVSTLTNLDWEES